MLPALTFDLITAAVLIITAACFLPFLPRLCATLSPLTPHAGIALVFLWPLAIFLPIDIHATSWIMMLLATGLQIFHGLPFILPAKRPQLKKQALILFQANVLRSNLDAAPLLREIQRQKPDVIVLCELTKAYAQQLQPLSDLYPYYKADIREDSFGMGIFSKLSLKNAAVQKLSVADIPSIMADVETPLGDIALLAVHPHNPLRDVTARNNELTAIEKWMASHHHAPAIVTGDLNVTPFCAAFRRLHQNGFSHGRLGRGHLQTWPQFLPEGPWRIAIDHTFASSSLSITAFKIGTPIGSDHLPTISAIAFTQCK